MKLVKMLVCLFFAVLLSACGPSNPLIGSWEADLESSKFLGQRVDKFAVNAANAIGAGGMNRLEFTSSSIKNKGLEIKVKAYKVEKGKVGVVIENLAGQAQEVTQWYEVIDENTIETDMGVMKMRFRRVGSKSKPANKDDDKAKLEQPPAPQVEERKLPQADTQTPLGSYQPIADGNDLMYAYYAVSNIPVPYETIAERISADYRATTDVFKKQDILKAIQSGIDTKVMEKKSRYFLYALDNVRLDHYDLASKSFPINAFTKDSYYYFNSYPDFKLSFTNPEQFNQLKVDDSNSARALEEMVSQGKLSNNVKVYLYAQEADLNNHQLKAQIVNIIIFDLQGNQIVKFRQ